MASRQSVPGPGPTILLASGVARASILFEPGWQLSMQRFDSEEILDSAQCPRSERDASLRDLCRLNRWFGGVATTRNMIARVSASTGEKHFSLLDVAAGYGEVPRAAAAQLAKKGIALEITAVDRLHSNLRPGRGAVVADALALPFRQESFDLVSCSLFAHHLDPSGLARFVDEALRVARIAVLINDLIRHPLHLALVYAGFPLMRSYVSRADGVASVRRAYVPEEIRDVLSNQHSEGRRIEISRHYLFRMGVMVWNITSSKPSQIDRLRRIA